MKPRADLSARDRKALIEVFERAVQEIPVVRSVRIGRRVTHGAQYELAPPDAEFLILIDFDDLAGLQTYLKHLAHSSQQTRILFVLLLVERDQNVEAVAH